MPAKAGIQYSAASAIKTLGLWDTGSPEFTNEVQHFRKEVLRWDGSTNSFHWNNDARLPAFAGMTSEFDGAQ
jgi:hypothetical protein